MAKLDKVTLRGFKSIEKLEDFALGDLNVLIGANGAGKSNFIDFFRLLRAMVEERLQLFVGRNGPADGYFYNGVSFTRKIDADLTFGDNRYVFTLEPTAEGKIIVAQEQTQYVPKGILVYHFQDTSMTSGMRRDVGVEQFAVLQPDASNLGALLLDLRDAHRERYELLRKTLQRIAPYFDDFDLRVTKATPQDTVRITWRRKGSDYIFSPGHLSDGTIRFLCLATSLLQLKPPTTIVFDEPELGLHPEALAVLGGLIRSASSRMQIILATQSPMLLGEFEPEQVITVDQMDGATRFSRLDPAALAVWLNEFTLGELWQKGTIRGGVNNA